MGWMNETHSSVSHKLDTESRSRVAYSTNLQDRSTVYQKLQQKEESHHSTTMQFVKVHLTAKQGWNDLKLLKSTLKQIPGQQDGCHVAAHEKQHSLCLTSVQLQTRSTHGESMVWLGQFPLALFAAKSNVYRVHGTCVNCAFPSFLAYLLHTRACMMPVTTYVSSHYPTMTPQIFLPGSSYNHALAQGVDQYPRSICTHVKRKEDSPLHNGRISRVPLCPPTCLALRTQESWHYQTLRANTQLWNLGQLQAYIYSLCFSAKVKYTKGKGKYKKNTIRLPLLPFSFSLLRTCTHIHTHHIL